MIHSRHAELRQMLEVRCNLIAAQVQQNKWAFRDSAGVGTTRPPADVSEPAPEDLDFALVDMYAQTLKNIAAALARLSAGDYGVRNDCEEEISGKRLRALAFATTFLSCQGKTEDAWSVVPRGAVADRT